MKKMFLLAFLLGISLLGAREVQSLPEQWRFSGLVYDLTDFPAAKLPANAEKPEFDDCRWSLRPVPKNWLEDIPEARKQVYMSGMYRTSVKIPAAWKSGRTLLHFYGASYETTVFVNGRKTGFHRGAYADFLVDITKEVVPDKDNLIAVRVDYTNDRTRRATLNNYPFPGDRGGLYGPVVLEHVPEILIERTFVDASPADGKVSARLRVNNTSGKAVKLPLTVRVDQKTYFSGTADLKPGRQEICAGFQFRDHKNWEVGNPQLYRAEFRLGKDICQTSFGFARFETRGDRLFFNGTPITLFARHFSGCFLPNGAPRRLGAISVPWEVQKESVRALFQDQLKDNCNMIRFHGAHGSPKFAYEASDEAGILVYQEWSTYGIGKNLADKYLPDAIEELGEFLEMVYNDPSVVMLSFANESPGTRAQTAAYRATAQRFGKRFVYCATSGFLPILSGKLKDPPPTDIFDVHTYIGMSFRVMMPEEKVSWVMMPERLKEIHQRFKDSYREAGLPAEKPFLAMEVPAGGWSHAQIGKYSQYFDKNGEVTPEAYIKANAESEKRGFLALGGWDMKNASLLDKLAGAKRNMAVLNKIDKHSIEGVRLYPRVRGICVATATKHPPLIQKIVYQNVLAILKYHDRHFFTDKPAVLTGVIINDSPEPLKQPSLKWSIRRSGGELPGYDELKKHISDKPLLAGEAALSALAAGERMETRIELPLTPALPDGDYELDLAVYDGEKCRSINADILYLAGRSHEPVPVDGKCLVLGEGGAAQRLSALLQRKKIGVKTIPLSFDPVRLREELKEVKYLILAPVQCDAHGPLAKIGPALRHWVEQGGKLLAMELSGTGRIPFVPEWSLGNEGPSWFADIGPGRGHPAFQGLAQRHFDSWNGDYGYLARSVVLPMNLNMLAVTACVESDQLGASLLEAKIKNGKVLLSQLLALSRADNDPAAARYLDNLLRYFFAGKDYRTCKELLAGKKYTYDCDPAQCFFVNLRPYVNRNLYDTTPDSHDGWTDQGDNDLRHIPRGRMDQDKRIWEIEYNPVMRDKQFFAGIPFDVIEPKNNGNKACIVLAGELRREFPKEVKGIRVGKKAVRLYFLHTAVFGHGKNVGRYVIHYADGTEETIELRGKREIGDWWAPVHLDQALRAWNGTHPVTRQNVGVYAMEYVNPHPERVIESIDFISSGKVVPILLAITGRSK